MSTRELHAALLVVTIGWCWAATTTLGADRPGGSGLGQAATPQQITDWDISIAPDGRGLPPGSGDATAGEPLYQSRCEACHGPRGRGASAEELVGGVAELTGAYPEKTVGSYWPYATTLFDYIRRAMPMDRPLSLTDDEVYALSAYLLYLNDLIGQTELMTAETLPRVQMPNRDGFVRIDAPAGAPAR